MLYKVILFRYCTDVFLCSEEPGAYYGSFIHSGIRKLFRINHLPYSSDSRSCYSLLFLETCKILEKIRTKLCEDVRKEEATVRH